MQETVFDAHDRGFTPFTGDLRTRHLTKWLPPELIKIVGAMATA
jgi:hypothetical protein